MNALDLPACTQLIKKEEIEAAGERAVNCARCARLGNFDSERQGGFCLFFCRRQSTWHPVLCNRFQKKE